MYYWLGRRFNKTGDGNRDTQELVRVPPQEASFLRPIGLNDPDRHRRPAWKDEYETIAQYTQSGSKITLNGTDADEDIVTCTVYVPGGNKPFCTTSAPPLWPCK